MFTKDFGVKKYLSPRHKVLTDEESGIRDVAYGLKTSDVAAIDIASKAMSEFVDSESILIPIPSSKGDTVSNKSLAEAISRLSGSIVIDALYREVEVESSSSRRSKGLVGLKPHEHHIMVNKEMLSGIPLSKIVYIDNVITTGSTGKSAKMAVGGGRVLAYAKAQENQVSKINAFEVKGP